TSLPTVAPLSSTSNPEASSESPSSFAEHSMPCDSTPRIDAGVIGTPPGSFAPTSAQGTTMPGAALGAPQTIDNGAALPTSTLHTVNRSALGWRSTLRSLPTTTPVNGGAAGARSSTSRPAIVSRCASSSLLMLGLTKERSQCSENFIGLAPYAN